MKKVVLVTAMVLVVCQMAMGAIVEDFSSDPAARGWVDASPNSFSYGPGAYASGYANQSYNEAYYVPLGTTYTQADNFWAKFDFGYYTGSATNQEMFVGFLNKDNWMSSTSATPIDTVNMWVYNGWTPPPAARMEASVGTTSGTFRMEAGGSVWHAETYNSLNSHLMTYTAGAGANGAGQLVINAYNQGDYNGTPLWTATLDLSAGDTFSVNAFGLFEGHRGYNGTTGLWPYMMYAEVAPEPATMILLGLGSLLLRRKH